MLGLGGGHPMRRHTCTIVVGLEGSGTRFIARELSKLLQGDCSPVVRGRAGKGVTASGCDWNGEAPPCWSGRYKGLPWSNDGGETWSSGHFIQHVSLPWGGVCAHDSWYVLQRSAMCFGKPEPGRISAATRTLVFPPTFD